MAPKIIRRRVSELKHGPNIRRDLGTEEELRRHGRSLRKWQRTPLVILPDGTTLDGNRSLAAARLEGIEELDCIEIPAADGDDYKRLQWTANVHRQDIAPYDKALAIRDIKADSTLSNKQLAEEVLDIDPTLVTKYLALFDCIPEVQEAAEAGKIGVADWYAISGATDQAGALAKALGRKRGNGSNGNGGGKRAARWRIPLATDAATGTVTLSGEGDELDYEAAETLLKEAARAVKAAKEKNLEPKTAEKMWRDMAKSI